MSAWSSPTCGRAPAVSSILTAITLLVLGFSPVSGLIAGIGGVDDLRGGLLVAGLEPPLQAAKRLLSAVSAAAQRRIRRPCGVVPRRTRTDCSSPGLRETAPRAPSRAVSRRGGAVVDEDHPCPAGCEGDGFAVRVDEGCAA